MKDRLGMFFGAFPDLKSTLNQIVDEGDWVVGSMTSGGTQTGEFMGIPATGKTVFFSEMHIVRSSDGKDVEHHGSADAMAMMQQLGVTPEN